MTAQFILFLLLFLAERTAVILLRLQFVKLALDWRLLILLIKPLTETIQEKKAQKDSMYSWSSSASSNFPTKKSNFCLFFVVKRELQTLPRSRCIMQPLSEQNLELVAASLIKTSLLLFYQVLSAFFVVTILINFFSGFARRLLLQKIERTLGSGVVKLHVIVETRYRE